LGTIDLAEAGEPKRIFKYNTLSAFSFYLWLGYENGYEKETFGSWHPVHFDFQVPAIAQIQPAP
jgi:hypothetical protein